MKIQKALMRCLSLSLTCCLLLESLPSTAFAVVADTVNSIDISLNSDLDTEAIPFTEETSSLENETTITETEQSESEPDYNKNAAYKTSGLTLEVFKKASELHGGDNALSRELAALNSGVIDDSLSKTDAVDIRRLICSGYTYRQARAAIVAAETLDVSISELCTAKEAELSSTSETTNEINSFALITDYISTNKSADSETHGVATKLGVPDSLVENYMSANKVETDNLLSEFKTKLYTSYQDSSSSVRSDNSVLPESSSQANTSALATSTYYTPDQILDNPYDYKEYGNLDVNLSSGSYQYSETDLSIPGINGLDLNFARIFNSAFSYSQYPRGYTSGYSTDEYTLRVSFDIYVSYTGNTYTLVSDVSDYEEVQPEVLDLIELNCDFKTSEYEDAIDYRTALALHPDVNGVTWLAYDADGELAYMRLHPTLKAIGLFEDAFDNISQDYDYLVNEFGLGHGWRLGFSAIERYYAGTNNGYKYRLILSDGSVYPLSSTFSIISDFDNMTLTTSSSQIDYAGAKYKLTYADGKREYFDANGRNIAIMDRYNNKITLEYEYADPETEKVIIQIKITDTLGNIIIYKKETLPLGEDGYLTIDGLSSGRSMHDSKWNLTLNGNHIRSYYSYKDPDVAEWPRKLQVVENELSEYTLYATSTPSVDYNSFVMVPTTNDGTIFYASLNYIRYANDLKLDVLAHSSRTGREFLGDGGYKDTLHFGGTVSIAELDSGDVRKEYTKMEIGDSSGYYVIPDEDLEYTSTETVYRSTPYESGYAIWKSKVTDYLFDWEHNLVEEIVYAHGAVQENEYPATSADRALLGEYTHTTYRYGNYPVPTGVSIQTFEPGNTENYTYASYYYTYDAKGNTTKETLPNGNVINYAYSPDYNILLSKTYNQDADTVIVEQNTLTSDNKAIAQTVLTRNGETAAKTTYTYDALGRMTGSNTYTSASDYTTQTFSYDSSAQPTQISVSAVTDVDGEAATATPNSTAGTIVEKTSYNGRGWPTSYTDGNGNTTTITYDAVGRITQVTYPNGGTDKYEYDIEAGTVKYTDPNNNAVTYQYDYFGNLTSITDNISGSTLVTYDYDSLNNRNLEIIHSSVDGNDQSTYTYYDNLGRIIETGIRNADDSDTPLETYAYSVVEVDDVMLMKSSQTIIGSGDAPNQVNNVYKDKTGVVVKEGRRESSISELIDSYTYDYMGNCVEFIPAYLNQSTSVYPTLYTYDHAGNVITETDPLGNVKTYTYNWIGNMLTATDAKGSVTTNTYDNLGRLLKTTAPIDSTTYNVVKYYYDSAGNVTKQQNSTGTAHTNGIPDSYNTILYSYDSMNRLTRVQENAVDSQNIEFTTYTYDLNGNITQVSAGTRQNGNSITVSPSITTYTYDRFGNVLTEKDALNRTETYTYDLNGQVQTKLDRNGVLTQYAYDNRGRVVSETMGSGEDQLVHSYIYALNGALLSETMGDSTITYVYDVFGRLKEEYTAPYLKSYFYNDADKVSAFTLEEDDNRLIYNSCAYDKLSRMMWLMDIESDAHVDYEYDVNSNLVSIEYDNNVIETYSYNAANLITGVTAKDGSLVRTQYQYTYDLAGRQISMTDKAGSTTTYSYDPRGQLILDSRTGGTDVVNYSNNFLYDSHGNRIVSYGNGIADNLKEFTYDLSNRLVSQSEYDADFVETLTSYTYDGNGNMLTSQEGADSTTTYTYDVANRLIGVSGEDVNATYTYYANGLRKTKTVNGVTTTYVWDGDKLVYETGASTIRYIYGAGDALIANVKGSTETYYQHDAHGNVVALTNSSGSVTRTYEYDAFGNQLNIDPADTNPFRYCGEYYDAETGSYYLRARYYDSSIGRFTQQDTYRGNINLPISLNYYTYCYNNPIRYEDRSGNFPIDTLFDFTSAGWSLLEFLKNPTVSNAAFLLWDTAAVLMPYVPGSYALTGIKVLSKTDDAGDLVRLFSKVSDFNDSAQTFNNNYSSFVGSYKNLKKAVKTFGTENVEVHHLIEKRFASTLGLKSDDILSIILDKDTHQSITNSFRYKIGYTGDHTRITTRIADANNIWDAVVYAYTENDMEHYIPLLKEFLLENATHVDNITDWKGW